MILNHVTHDADPIIEARPVTDIDCLGRSDLDMINVIAVPHRLIKRVGEPKHEQVLNGFLAQIVVDSVDLRLRQDLMNRQVKLARRDQVVSERLLNNHPPPAVFLMDHIGRSKVGYGYLIQIGRNGQVVDPIGSSFALPVAQFPIKQD